jgi:hypothetical protein
MRTARKSLIPKDISPVGLLAGETPVDSERFMMGSLPVEKVTTLRVRKRGQSQAIYYLREVRTCHLIYRGGSERKLNSFLAGMLSVLEGGDEAHGDYDRQEYRAGVNAGRYYWPEAAKRNERRMTFEIVD